MRTQGRGEAGAGMAVMVMVALAVVLCAAVEGASAQACVPFRGSPHTGGKCDALVTYPNVLLRPNQTYEQVDQGAANRTRTFGAFLPPACRRAALRLTCLGSFVSCRFNSTLAFFPPCRSVCEEMVSECAAVFKERGRAASSLPNCSAVDHTTGRPRFPTDNCNNHSHGVAVPYSQADCPYPLKINKRGTVGDPSLSLWADEQICVYPCPAPAFSPEDWHASAGITISLAVLSIVVVLFLTITYILSPRKRRFPTSFQLWVCVSSLISSVGIGISVLVGGPERTNCTWDDTPVLQTFAGARDNDGQGVVCVLQGMMVMFGALAGSFWWVMLTYTIFQFLVFEISSDRARRMLHIVSHIVSWGIPTLLVTIALGAQQFEARAVGHNCFVVAEWDWGLFYGPVCLNLVIGTTLMVISIIKVLRVSWCGRVIVRFDFI